MPSRLPAAALALAAALPARAAGDTAPTPAGTAAEMAPLDLRVGEHRFRIPRARFRHPPYPSGAGTGFRVRALRPGMEPETEATRTAFRASILTAEGQRALPVLPEKNQPGISWPVARWMPMPQNAASGPGRAETDRAGLEAFAPPRRPRRRTARCRRRPGRGHPHRLRPAPRMDRPPAASAGRTRACAGRGKPCRPYVIPVGPGVPRGACGLSRPQHAYGERDDAPR